MLAGYTTKSPENFMLQYTITAKHRSIDLKILLYLSVKEEEQNKETASSRVL